MTPKQIAEYTRSIIESFYRDSDRRDYEFIRRTPSKQWPVHIRHKYLARNVSEG